MRRTFLILILLLFAPIAQAAVYHIDPTVGTSGTGTAASPFKSWSNLPSMSTGDDVYFKCGTTFQPTSRCLVSWGGTAEDRAVIGAYYLSGSTAIYDVSGDRPILNGQTHTYPSRTSYHGMVHVISKDYVTIENLDITESGYYGIAIAGSITNYPTSYDNSAYFIIQNCRVYSSYGNGIMVSSNPYNYGVIDRCEVGKSSEKSRLYSQPLTGALTLASNPYAYTEIKNCTVYDSHGEGIGSNRVIANATSANTGYANIHNNLMYNNKQLSIYLDASSYNEVHDNLIFGLGHDSIGVYTLSIQDGRKWNGSGIVVNTENTRGGTVVPILADSLNYNKVYNNLIAGCSTGITLSSDHIPSEGGTLTMTGNEIYNNTLIANRRNLNFGSKLSEYTMSGNVVRNNVSFCPADSNTSINVATDYSWIDSKVTLNHNAWTTATPTYTGDSGTDVVITATDSGFEKTSGWQALTGVIDAANFQLKSTSTLIDEGVNLSAVFTTDYFAETRGASWDIGADEYISPGGLPSNTVTAHYMSSAPTIDGTLTEWASIDGFVITDATTSKSGTYKIAFDGTYLYLSGSVTDTTLNSTRETRDTDVWKDDSFELMLGSAITTDDNKATTDHKLTMNIGGYTNDAVGAGTTVWDTSWAPTIGQAFVNTGTLNDANADTGYAFEARISWADLGVTAPTDDDIWQFDFNQNDRDDDDTRTYNWFWNSDGGDVNNPLGWGRLLFDIPGGGGSGGGLISMWEFDSGALTTDSVGTNTLTNNATITESTDKRSGTGSADLEASSSQYFSRTDANLSSGFPGKSGETNKSFTSGCWFKAESFGEFNTLLSKYNGTAGDRTWHLSVREVSSGSGTYSVQAQLGYNSGASSYDSAKHASTLSTGTWYFAAMSYDASDNSWAIRVRDSQCRDVGTDATGTATLDANGLSITDADFKIGALGATTQFFDGLLDKAFVYNTALSESEIEAICGTTRRSRPGAILLGW